jgi:hypothetical protein
MAVIEEKLALSRQKLIALSLLCGCDYNDKGVLGVGKETALKFLEQLEDDEIFPRYEAVFDVMSGGVTRIVCHYSSSPIPNFPVFAYVVLCLQNCFSLVYSICADLIPIVCQCLHFDFGEARIPSMCIRFLHKGWSVKNAGYFM